MPQTFFSSDLEGWTVVTNTGDPANAFFNSNDGVNGSGALVFDDNTSFIEKLVAPSSYHGDQLGSIDYSTEPVELKFQLKLEVGNNLLGPKTITITGNEGQTLVYQFTGVANDEFVEYTIDLKSPTGGTGAGDPEAVLRDIEDIRMDFDFATSTPGNDQVTIDNIFFITCFSSGTLINDGCRNNKVESLAVGDLVLTSSGDLRPIRWIGSRKFDAIDLAANPKLRPVRIKAGALGENMPEEDLWVSRQHRVLVRSAIAQRMFGTDEVLIPAIKLIELDGIEVDEEMQEVEYYHLLFDQHEVICSNGAWTESLFTGPEALKAVSPEARKEIETIFPVICEPDFEPTPARHIPQKGKLMKELIARHKKNQKPIYNA